MLPADYSVVADRYRIERQIGRGGMAAVYLAHDEKHGRDVALKFLVGPYPDPVAVRRFLREIVTLAQLAHPHILPLYDSGEQDGTLFFVMPYVTGGSLRTRLVTEKMLPVADVARLAREMADALAFAHARGYVHRDIKPENVLIADGHALLADFGIARVETPIGDPTLTATGVGLGTPAYMSPEQACGDPADARSDLYSLACVLYEALVGEPPVSPRGLSGMAFDRFLTPPEPLRRRRRDVPAALERTILCALRLAPGDRFANASAFIRSLEGEPPPMPRRSSVGVRIRRHPWLTSVGTAGLALVALLALRRGPTGNARHLLPFVSDAEAAETRSPRAHDTYVAAHRALAAWDLAGASRQFGAAVQADPQFAQAQLWLAQTMEWQNPVYAAPPPTWKLTVDRAMSLRSRLGPHDQRSIQALSALADGRYAEACDHYSEMVKADSQDFIAWFGMGECQSQDRLVVHDPSSPSGWRFRSSMDGAVNAYARALRILPEFQEAFVNIGSERLSRLLWTQSNDLRRGYALAANGDTLFFAAFPGLSHDTLTFVPYSWADVRAGLAITRPVTNSEAIARNSRLLRGVAADWVHAVPSSSAAHLHLARALEAVGAIAAVAAGDTDAIDEARRARELSVQRLQRLTAMLDEVRFDLEIERFAAARSLADSLLATSTLPTAQEALIIATAAALTGHVYRTVAALRMTASVDTMWLPPPEQFRLAPVVPASEALAFLGYASCGAPADSIRAAAERTARAVAVWVDPTHRQSVDRALMDWPATLAFHEIGVSPEHRPDEGLNTQLARQWYVARGDTAREREYITEENARLRLAMPGDADPAGPFLDARLALAIGDTANAIAELDFHGLQAIPRFGLRLTDGPSETAPFVRSMALRADLAHDQGDARTAGHWARAVVTLWGGADPELQPVVSRARALLQQ
ncbi:MAG TPA: serine/threonine-protein kinase [Gemmatimonadaceae bacterium]|nr:serine/threonine-protein kinase [Gemmatimonadaceae bacterium]